MNSSFGKTHLFTDRSGSNQISLKAGPGETLGIDSQLFINPQLDVSDTNTNGALVITGGIYANTIRADNFYGALDGSVNRLNVNISDAAAAVHYPLFTVGTSTNQLVYNNTSFQMVPNQGLVNMVNANITTGTITNLQLNNLSITSGTITNLNNSSATMGNLETVNGTINALSVSRGTISSGTIANLTTNNTRILTSLLVGQDTTATLVSSGISTFKRTVTMSGDNPAKNYSPNDGLSVAMNIPRASAQMTNSTTNYLNTVSIFDTDLYGAPTGSTVGKACTLYISSAPYPFTNITIETRYALLVEAGLAGFDSIEVTTLNSTISVSTIAKLTTLSCTTANLQTINGTNAIVTSGTITGLTTSNARITSGTTTDMNITNARITSGTCTDLTVTNSRITSDTTGSMRITGTSAATNASTGSVVISGGLGISKSIYGCQPYLFFEGSGTVTAGGTTILTSSHWTSRTLHGGATFNTSTGKIQFPETGIYMTLYQVEFIRVGTVDVCQIGITADTAGTNILAYGQDISESNIGVSVHVSCGVNIAANTDYYSYVYQSGSSTTVNLNGRVAKLLMYKII